MILQHALPPVRPGEEAGFEAAFAQAHPITAGMPGFGTRPSTSSDGTQLVQRRQ